MDWRFQSFSHFKVLTDPASGDLADGAPDDGGARPMIGVGFRVLSNSADIVVTKKSGVDETYPSASPPDGVEFVKFNDIVCTTGVIVVYYGEA